MTDEERRKLQQTLDDLEAQAELKRSEEAARALPSLPGEDRASLPPPSGPSPVEIQGVIDGISAQLHEPSLPEPAVERKELADLQDEQVEQLKEIVKQQIQDREALKHEHPQHPTAPEHGPPNLGPEAHKILHPDTPVLQAEVRDSHDLLAERVAHELENNAAVSGVGVLVNTLIAAKAIHDVVTELKSEHRVDRALDLHQNSPEGDAFNRANTVAHEENALRSQVAANAREIENARPAPDQEALNPKVIALASKHDQDRASLERDITRRTKEIADQFADRSREEQTQRAKDMADMAEAARQALIRKQERELAELRRPEIGEPNLRF